MRLRSDPLSQNEAGNPAPQLADSSVDFESVRDLFVHGTTTDDGTRRWPSLPELSKTFDIPEETLAARSRRERWRQERSLDQERYERERSRQEHAERVAQMDKLNALTVDTAQSAMVLANRRVKEMLDDVPEPGGWEQARPFDSAELNRLISTTDSARTLALTALGVSSGTPSEDVMPSDREAQANIAEELLRDDPDRLWAIIEAMDETGLFADPDGDGGGG